MSDMSAQVRRALDVAVEAIGGSPREGQIEMAEAVANALTNRHHLMVQAGTGTGKSLAYLIPGIVHGRKVLVATATIALQRQLVDRDLPAVVPALEKELGRDITYAIYKGVGNYVCLQKMNSEEVDPDTELVMEVSSLEKDAKRLIAWAKTPGVSGDRDDAPEVDRRVWLANSTSGRECVGADVCAFGSQCFAANAKAKAQTADIVVTNHTLLAIEIVDSHPILPERDCVILDEAHEFMDRATQAVTDELTSNRVLRAAAMARKFMPGKLSDAFHKAANDFHESMVDYGEDIKGDFSSQGRLEEIPQSLEFSIRKVMEASKAIVQFMSADDEIIDTDALAERARVKGAVTEIAGINGGSTITFDATGDYMYEFISSDYGASFFCRELGRAPSKVHGNLTVTGNTVVNGGMINTNFQYLTRTTGQTLVANTAITHYYLDSASSATLATQTITVPPTAENGRILMFTALCPITTTTFNGGAGQTTAGAYGALKDAVASATGISVGSITITTSTALNGDGTFTFA